MPEAGVDIAASAAVCYERFCAVERGPEWDGGVAHVAVLAADDAGRPVLVRVVCGPERGSLAHQLAYEYDDAAHAVRWRSVEVALRDLRAHAVFRDVAPGRCRLECGMHNVVGELLPAWARAVLGADGPDKLTYRFRRWIET